MFYFYFNGEKVQAFTLANYILKKAAEIQAEVSNTKLQKILYYVQGYYLAKFDHPLYPEEIHAWTFGPAVPDVYYAFSRYGPDPLHMTEEPDMSSCTPDELALIDRVISNKLVFSKNDLVRATIQEDPWLSVTNNGEHITLNQVIPTEIIKEYFKLRE